MSWINCFAEKPSFELSAQSLRPLRLRGKATSVRDFFHSEVQKTQSCAEDVN
jgi:hypothetical protein